MTLPLIPYNISGYDLDSVKNELGSILADIARQFASETAATLALGEHTTEFLTYQYGTTAAASSHSGISTGYIIQTRYHDSNKTAGSGAQFRFTGTTTAGKGGTWPNADGYFYDADGKQFSVIGVPINVRWFGATGDGVTNDYAACAAAVAAVEVSGGGLVYSPAGTYLLGTTLTCTNLGVILDGDGVDNTVLKASHTSGPVVRIKGAFSGVTNLSVDATAARTSGGAITDYGILQEPPDTASTTAKGCVYKSFIVRNQPGHGLALVNGFMGVEISTFRVHDNSGHGVIIDGGALTGRTNTTRAGGVEIKNGVIQDNVGHSICAGADDGTTASICYRIHVNDVDTFRNAITAGVRKSAHDAWFYTESSVIELSAFSGYTGSAPRVATIGGVAMAGRSNFMRNNRYIDVLNNAVTIYNYTAQSTRGIIIDELLITGEVQVALDPAIVVSSGATHIRARSLNVTNITSLMTSTAVTAESELGNSTRSWAGDLTLAGAFSADNLTLTDPFTGQIADITYPLMSYGGYKFDGSTNYLDTNVLTGIADGKKFSVFVHIRFANAASGASELIISNNNSVFLLSRGTTGNISLTGKNAGGTTILSIATTGTPCASAGTYAIMVSGDLATAGSGKIYINQASNYAETTFTNDTIDYTVSEWSIGAGITGSSKFTGDMYTVWFDTASNLDFSSSAVRRRFIDVNGVPVFLGRNGELPTGMTPILFHGYDDYTSWPRNRGAATSAWTENGTPAAVTTAMNGQAVPIATIGIPKTVTADYTIDRTGTTIINNRAATNTLTLPDAALNGGRRLRIQTIQAQTVVSASSNVVPIAGGAAGTAILAAVDGEWADLESDGTNWQITAN